MQTRIGSTGKTSGRHTSVNGVLDWEYITICSLPRKEDTMSTFHKEFESITSETLQELIASGTVETIQLEYKQEVNNLVSLTEELCAFANTRGGDLFVGIIEDQGAASGFRGISNPDIDAEKLRYTNAIIGNTDLL